LLRYRSRVLFGAGVPTRDWLIVALGYLGAHKFGLWSLLYIPFPLQVLVKSCKTVPVMLGEVAFGAARITAKKVVGVAMVTVGIAVFMLFRGSKKSKMEGMADFDYFSTDMAIGCLLVLGALICDGVYGPYQNKIVQDARGRADAARASGAAADDAERLVPSAHHLMLNMNFWQGLFALAIILTHHLSGGANELLEVRSFVARNPDCFKPLTTFVAAMAIGNLFIYQLQRDFGALVVTLTTTIRKLFSVLLSSLPPTGVCNLVAFPLCAHISGFGNAINGMQWAGVAMVFSSKVLAGPIARLLVGGRKVKKQ
jgi:UDP-galactose transporter B1